MGHVVGRSRRPDREWILVRLFKCPFGGSEMPRGIRLVLVLSYATALRFPHYTPHNGKRCARRDFGMICTASLVGATKAQAAQASPPIVVPRERLMQFENMCHLNVHIKKKKLPNASIPKDSILKGARRG